MGILGALVGGVSDYFSAKENRKATEAQIKAQKEIIEGTKAAAGEANALIDESNRYAFDNIWAGERDANALLGQQYGNAVDLTSDWRKMGDAAMQGMMNTPDFNFDRDFNFEDFSFGADEFMKYKDPSYDWRLDQGIEARDRSAASRGNVLSGAQNKAITQYGQDMASQEYSNAFDRYSDEYNKNYNNALTDYDRDFAKEQGVYNTNFDRNNIMAGYGQNATNNLMSSGNQLYSNMATNSNDRGINLANILGTSSKQKGTNLINAAAGVGTAVGNIGDARATGYANQGAIVNNAAQNALLAYNTYQGAPTSGYVNSNQPINNQPSGDWINQF